MGRMFDRARELSELLRMYEECRRRGVGCGVLVYGWRRVGKTTLLKEFASRVNGLYINCMWISDPYIFTRVVIEAINDEELRQRLRLLLSEEDPMIVFKQTFDALVELGRRRGVIAVVLDEFHVFLDKVALRIAREKRMRKDIVVRDIAAVIKEAVESKAVFWVLSTSIGWEKLRESVLKTREEGSPLVGLLVKLKIEPFDERTAVEFARYVNPSLTEDQAKEIYVITGGIPKLIEDLASRVRKGESVLKVALTLLERGEFDDFFENVVKFVAEAAKREFSLLIQTIKALGMDEKTTDDVAKHLRTDRTSAYILLEELVKMDVATKRKVGKRVFYRVKYPLLSAWVSLRVQPESRVLDVLARKLGVTLESYVKELLEEYARRGKSVEVRDDESGTFLFGTAPKLAFKPKEVLRTDEARKRFKLAHDFDLLVITEDRPVVIEVKLSASHLTTSDVEEVAKAAEEVSGLGIVVVESGEPVLPVVAHAAKRGVIIVSGEALKLLAKKINFVHW